MDLLEIQKTLSVKKGEGAYSKSGEKIYSYRSLDSILEKIKPILEEPIIPHEELIIAGDRCFKNVKIKYKGEEVNYIVELDPKPSGGKSFGQASGEAGTYALKYALCNLFLIDSGDDLDKRDDRITEEAARKEIASLVSLEIGRENLKEFKDKYFTAKYNGSFISWKEDIYKHIEDYKINKGG